MNVDASENSVLQHQVQKCLHLWTEKNIPEWSVIVEKGSWLWWLYESSRKCYWAKWEERRLSDILLSSSVPFKCFKWWSLTVQRLKGNQSVLFKIFQCHYGALELVSVLIIIIFFPLNSYLCPNLSTQYYVFQKFWCSQISGGISAMLHPCFHALLFWNMFIYVSSSTGARELFKWCTPPVGRLLALLSSSSHSSCDETREWNLFVSWNVDERVEISIHVTLTWNV